MEKVQNVGTKSAFMHFIYLFVYSNIKTYFILLLLCLQITNSNTLPNRFNPTTSNTKIRTYMNMISSSYT